MSEWQVGRLCLVTRWSWYVMLINCGPKVGEIGMSFHPDAFAKHIKDQGPVVQSVVSLTISLRVISLTVLADSKHNILIFFAEKM